MHFNKILKGSHGGGAIPDEGIPRYLKLLKAQKMHLNKLVTNKFSLQDVNQAIATMRSGQAAGRVLINMLNN